MKYLGKHATAFKTLDTVPGPVGGCVTLTCNEYTSICPVTHQPDFGTIIIQYEPTGQLIETKSLKLYIQSLRDERTFVESSIASIADYLWSVFDCAWLTVEGKFNSRGGIEPGYKCTRVKDRRQRQRQRQRIGDIVVMKEKSGKAVVIYSGGMDSTTLLHYALANFEKVLAVSFDYDQRHKVELTYAHDYCKALSIPWRHVQLGPAIFGNSSLTNPDVDVPHGHYEDSSMRLTVVPNRNMVMISIAASIAMGEKFTHLLYGAHGGDHAIYPDCRPEFANAMSSALYLSDWNPVQLSYPFIHMSKGDICKLGGGLGVDFANTWTCYDPQPSPPPIPYTAREAYIHCGQCGSCVERQEAFKLADIIDLTDYKVKVVQ